MPTRELVKARRATQLIFLVCGLGVSSWAPMVPYAKDRLHLNDEDLGFLLLFLGFGAITTMPVAGLLMKRWGSRRIILATALVVAGVLPLLLTIQSTALMSVALFVFGAGIGSIDVAMNAHGVTVQNAYGRPIMSSLHGLFSVGGLFGSLGLGFLIKTGLQPLHAAFSISILLVSIAVSQYKHLLSQAAETQDRTPHSAATDKSAEPAQLVEPTEPAKRSKAAKPAPLRRFHWPVVFLGLLCFSAFLTEGAMLDWSALYLRDFKHVAPELSGAGYAAFSVAMATMRLIGDKLVERLNNVRIVVGGCLIAAAGLLLTMSTTSIALALAGYVWLGVGAANVVPVFFSDGGKLTGISPLLSIPVITTMGYAGQLAGPAILGFIAHHSSLTMAFGFTMMLLILIAISYYFNKTSVSHQPGYNSI